MIHAITHISTCNNRKFQQFGVTMIRGYKNNSCVQEISFDHTPMSFRLRGKFFTCCFSLEREHITSNRNFYYNRRRPQCMLSVEIIPVPRQIHSLEYDLSHAGNCLRLNSLQMLSLFAHECTTKVMIMHFHEMYTSTV